MTLDPRTVGPRARAEQLIRLHRPEEAASLLAQALASDPTDVRAHRLLSQSLIQMGRFKEALGETDAAIRLDPESEWSFRLRSLALLSLGRRPLGLLNVPATRKRRAGLAAAKTAVRLAPEQSIGFVQLCSAYLANSRPTNASGAAEQAVRLAPESSVAWNVLGVVGLRLGRVDAAEAAFHKALQINPENAEALNNLGLVARAQGRRAEAPGLYGAAARTNPRSRTGPENAARMSNALLGQTLITVMALLVLAVFQAVGRADRSPVWWLVAIAAGGGAYLARRAWRSVRDRYRPRLLAFSLRKVGRLTSLGIAFVAGLAAWAISGPITAAILVPGSYALSWVGLGRSRRSGSRRRGPIFDVTVLVILLLLTGGAVALALGVALPAQLRAPADSLGPVLDLAGSLLLAAVLGIFLVVDIRILRWRASGGSPLLDQLEADASTAERRDAMQTADDPDEPALGSSGSD